MLPLKAMVACIAFLSNDVPICSGPHDKFYICVQERCATLRQLTIEFQKHPKKHAEFLRDVYGIDK